MLIEMTIKGLMVDPVTNVPIVILKDKQGERVLPIWVGVFEANAIALQIENIATPRPMTHDLLRNVISDLDGQVDRILPHVLELELLDIDDKIADEEIGVRRNGDLDRHVDTRHHELPVLIHKVHFYRMMPLLDPTEGEPERHGALRMDRR